MRSVCSLLLALTVAAGCAPYEPGPLAAEMTEASEGRIYFNSVDAYDFGDYVSGTTTPRPIHGDLTLPEGEGPVRGAVILSHGSGGTSSLHRRMADTLVEQGLAVFLLDHFGPRDVGNTVRDQVRVTAQGMLGDVFAAQKLLASHPRIQPGTIGHMGWSKGGIVALIGAVDRFSEMAGRTEPLAFAVSFYPFCGFDLSGERLSSPLLILIGAEDDWTPAAPCAREADRLKAAGEPIEIRVYAGALHGFDSRSTGFESARAVTVRDTSPKCTLKVGPEGKTRTLDGQNGIETIDRRTAYLRACGERGITYGGQREARDDSAQRIRAFIDRALGP